MSVFLFHIWENSKREWLDMDTVGFRLWFTTFSHDSLHTLPTIQCRQLFKKTPSMRHAIFFYPISRGKKKHSTNPQSLLLLLYYKYPYQQKIYALFNLVKTPKALIGNLPRRNVSFSFWAYGTY